MHRIIATHIYIIHINQCKPMPSRRGNAHVWNYSVFNTFLCIPKGCKIVAISYVENRGTFKSRHKPRKKRDGSTVYSLMN